MAGIWLKARAKINLTLDVLARRRDGYHEVEMILQQLDLADRVGISVGKGRGPIRIESDCPGIPGDKENIAFQAAQLMREESNTKETVNIHMEKRIPIAAGLGGGSADAAAVIYGLNHLLGLNLGLRRMMDLGASIGADVPFCIMGGTAIARGKGEMLTPIASNVVLDILLVKPPFSVSTAWAYKNFNLTSVPKRPDTTEMIAELKYGNKGKIASGMVNVLEGVTASRYTEILNIKNRMIEMGALGAVMSGSGPTVAGVFENNLRAKTAAKYFGGLYEEVIVTKTAAIKRGE